MLEQAGAAKYIKTFDFYALANSVQQDDTETRQPQIVAINVHSKI